MTESSAKLVAVVIVVMITVADLFLILSLTAELRMVVVLVHQWFASNTSKLITPANNKKTDRLRVSFMCGISMIFFP